MINYKLNGIRYSNVFRFLALFDMFIELVLWIIGVYLRFETSEIDQIIKFQFTESIFDVILISSFKALILFILISELEISTIRIVLLTIKPPTNAQQQPDSSRNRRENLNVNTSNDNENLIEAEEINEEVVDQLEDGDSNLDDNTKKSVEYYRTIKQLLHLTILFVMLISAVYISVKFIFVLLDILSNAQNKTHMDDYHFSALVVELAFSLVQLIVSCLSWVFMIRLAGDVRKTAHLNQNEPHTNTEPKKVNIKRLASQAYPERYLIGIAFIMLIFASLSNIIVPFFFGAVVDAAVNYKDINEMNKYIGYLFLVLFAGSIASGIRSWLLEYSGQRVVARLRRQVFAAIMRQDIKFFDTNRTGELTSRMSSDTQALQNAVTSNLSMLLRNLIQIIGSIVFMLSLNPSLTGVLLAIVPVVSILAVQYGRYLRKLSKKFQDELAASNVIAEESISSARTVRSFAAEDKMGAEYEKNIGKSLNIGRFLAMASGGFMAFIGLLTSGALALVLWYGGKLVHDQKITTGVLASFLMYTLQVAMAFAMLSSLYGDFMSAVGASQRIFELLDSKPTIPLNSGFKPSTKEEDEEAFDGSLKLENINFSYPTRPESKVLDNVTINVEKAKTLALVGPSGSGKSTLFSLIERFYDPDSGDVVLGPNNKSLKYFNTKWLHSKIALVSQEPVLFGGSIKENISFGLDEEPDMEEIIKVSKLANAHDFIITFEKGYDTLVGERGIRLSGGQKQRIAIARALLMNPKLLLLDEATSALDSESEHLVQEAIDRAMKNRTVCVIAHRLSTVRNADRVIVLDKGVVTEQGTHDELCQLDGIYKRFVLKQLLTMENSQQQI